KARILIMHGGVHELLRYSELVRTCPNLLLDLSFTLLKYQGSSLDLDIMYLFRKLDQRICIGSDYPDFSPSQLRQRLAALCQGVSKSKLNNIFYKNLSDFISYEP